MFRYPLGASVPTPWAWGVGVEIEKADGSRFELFPHTWSHRDGAGRVTSTVTQLPLRLGWALTIHKAQGMTLDHVAVHLPDEWTRGLRYVAYSRARTLDGLVIDNRRTR